MVGYAAVMEHRAGQNGDQGENLPEREPLAFALEWTEDAGRIDPEWVYATREEANDVNESGCYGRATVTPLYRSPTLTDAEREAIRFAAVLYEQGGRAADASALRWLLDRTK